MKQFLSVGTNWICTTTQKVQSDIRTLVERKVLRLEHQFPKGCMDNVDKSVDKLGSRALHTSQCKGFTWCEKGDSNPISPPRKPCNSKARGARLPICLHFIHTTSWIWWPQSPESLLQKGANNALYWQHLCDQGDLHMIPKSFPSWRK